MLVIAEHDILERWYYIGAGAGLRLDRTQTEHVQFVGA